jgi:hypothetical protein
MFRELWKTLKKNYLNKEGIFLKEENILSKWWEKIRIEFILQFNKLFCALNRNKFCIL